MDNIKNVLNDVISQIVSRQELPPDKIQRIWSSAVTTQVLAHTRVVDFKKGVLVVYVDTCPWLYELKTQKKKLTDRFKEEVPGFQQLVFKIGKVV